MEKINTILFDLDGTLLPIDTMELTYRYIALLAEDFADLYEDKKALSARVLKACEAMIKDGNGKDVNIDLFFRDFMKQDPHDEALIVKRFEEFYINRFDEIKTILRTDREEGLTKRVMDYVFQKGYEVVIATNAVFPELAMGKRLKWVDIGPDQYDYALITHCENMHYAKPDIRYYEEILQKIGKKPEECFMIGNDMLEDLIAKKLGIKTYLATDYVIPRDVLIEPDYEGEFIDLFNIL